MKGSMCWSLSFATILPCSSFFRDQDISPLPRPSSRNKSRKHTEALQKLRCRGWGLWLWWRRAVWEDRQPQLSHRLVPTQGSEQASPTSPVLLEPQAAPESSHSERGWWGGPSGRACCVTEPSTHYTQDPVPGWPSQIACQDGEYLEPPWARSVSSPGETDIEMIGSPLPSRHALWGHPLLFHLSMPWHLVFCLSIFFLILFFGGGTKFTHFSRLLRHTIFRPGIMVSTYL